MPEPHLHILMFSANHSEYKIGLQWAIKWRIKFSDSTPLCVVTQKNHFHINCSRRGCSEKPFRKTCFRSDLQFSICYFNSKLFLFLFFSSQFFAQFVFTLFELQRSYIKDMQCDLLSYRYDDILN